MGQARLRKSGRGKRRTVMMRLNAPLCRPLLHLYAGITVSRSSVRGWIDDALEAFEAIE